MEKYRVFLNNKSFLVDVLVDKNKVSRVRVNNEEFAISIKPINKQVFMVFVNSKPFRIEILSESTALVNNQLIHFKIKPYIQPIASMITKTLVNRIKSTKFLVNAIFSPLTGKLVELHIKPNQRVKKGDVIAVIEAMKVRNEIRAPKDGTIKYVIDKEKKIVKKGDVIAKFE